MALKVRSKGQIVISKEIRDQMAIKPGWITIEQLADDHVGVYFPPEHRKSLKGSLLPHIKVHIVNSKEWNEARNHAWGEAVKKEY